MWSADGELISDGTALLGDGRFFWGMSYDPPLHADRLLRKHHPHPHLLPPREKGWKVVFIPQGDTGKCHERLLQEGDTIDVADLHLKVINTPGHTYGGICLYGHGALFIGDTMFHDSIGPSGIGTGTRSQPLDSIIDKLMVLLPEAVISPGHGSQTTIDAERKNNPYINSDLYRR